MTLSINIDDLVDHRKEVRLELVFKRRFDRTKNSPKKSLWSIPRRNFGT